MNLPCPSCGGELSFQSKNSLFVVCPYCTSSIIRHDMDLEKIGEMGELPEDASPIQIGMTGRYTNKFFYTSGRIIYEWEDGLWNEWHLYLDTGETAWLSDAQGEFAISTPLPLSELPMVNSFDLGGSYKVGNDIFQLSDIKEIKYSGSEGELPFKAERDYRSTVYDFTNIDGKFLSMEIPDDSSLEKLLYKGTYIDFWKLEPQNIRLFEGWI